MLHKALLVTLTLGSFAFAVTCMVTYWHPMHFSWVGDKRAKILNLREGGVWWFSKTAWDKYQSKSVWPPPPRREWGIWGVFAVSTDMTDGRRYVGVLGAGVRWCFQQTGYRRFEVMLSCRKLAIVFAIYPTIIVSIHALRRWHRNRRGLCLKCGYSLTGNVSGTCPECGTEIRPRPGRQGA
jgi:hypothetical protein